MEIVNIAHDEKGISSFTLGPKERKDFAMYRSSTYVRSRLKDPYKDSVIT